MDLPVINLVAQLLPTFTGDTFGSIVVAIYKWSLAVVGFAVFIQFLHAGFLYLTSAGNATKTGKAKTLMTNAIIGVILLVSAVLILNTINPQLKENNFELDVFNEEPIPRGTMRESEALAYFKVAGIKIKSGVSVHGISEKLVEALVLLKWRCGKGCYMKIQGVSEDGGWVDINGDDDLEDYIQDNMERLDCEGITCRDSYRDPLTGLRFTESLLLPNDFIMTLI